MNREFRIRKHFVRVVTTSTDYGSGTYRPGIHLFLRGPNGSPNGCGPKAWPLHMRIRRFRADHQWAKTGWHKRNTGPGHGYGWTNAIYIPVPHLTWARAYKLRRFGGLRLYKLNYRLVKAVL